MKGITCCGECIYYNMKKHKCTRGASKEIDAREHFYADCPFPDVAPVRHGKWIKNEDDYYSLTVYQCSECKEEWCFEVEEDIHDLNYNYCPNCGAKMDEE